MQLPLLAVLLLLLAVPLGLGGSSDPQEQRSDQPTVDPADVASIDAILNAVYDSISGPAGQPRQWARFRGLLHPDAARMMATINAPDGSESLLVMDADEYVARVDVPFTEGGFFEREIHREVVRFGHVAHAWSTYAISREEGGEIERRGMNSYQLWFDDERWYVTSILWDNEREDQPLPEELTGGGAR